MQTEKTEGKKEKAKYFGSEKTFKGFQAMCETMSGCCTYQNGASDCAAIMETMIKDNMEACCSP